MKSEITVDRARPSDLQAVLALLARYGLPQDGLREHLATTVVARRGSELIGCAAIETYRDGALLRSVAVVADLQGQGVGRKLAAAAIDLGREQDAAAIYLLTTTAERYFPKLGFEEIARAEVPASVQMSVEFTAACPSSAIVMRKMLRSA